MHMASLSAVPLTLNFQSQKLSSGFSGMGGSTSADASRGEF